MPDEIDIANDYAQRMEERNVAAIRKAAADIPLGGGQVNASNAA